MLIATNESMAILSSRTSHAPVDKWHGDLFEVEPTRRCSLGAIVGDRSAATLHR